MTPANICGMAKLKGLDIISVTDHNAADALPFVKKAADDCGLLFLPGIEVTTKEEVHLLGYFSRVADAMEAGAFFKSHLPNMKNRPAFFGNQIVYNSDDEQVAHEEALLIGATDLTLSQCVEAIRAFHGVCVPAHINRGANGILTNLGFMPKDASFQTLEVTPHLPIDESIMRAKGILHSSDAHRLGDISEPENSIRVSGRTSDDVLLGLECGQF